MLMLHGVVESQLVKQAAWFTIMGYNSDALYHYDETLKPSLVSELCVVLVDDARGRALKRCLRVAVYVKHVVVAGC